jgi:hypothetical protein
MHGYGEFHWTDGKKYYGYYDRDKKHGFGVFCWPNFSKVYLGGWKNGKQDGLGILLFDNGFIKHGLWINGNWVKWLKGSWEFEKYSAESHGYLHLLLQDPKKVLSIFTNKDYK